jgi:hypothetical protein
LHAESRTRQRAADAAVLAGGALLVVCAFLPWVRRGPGHSLHGHDLVDAVVALGNTVPGLSSMRLTIVWYLVPALGALTWVVFGIFGRRMHVLTIVAVLACVVGALAFVAFGRGVGFGDLALGAYFALVGALLCGAGGVIRA